MERGHGYPLGDRDRPGRGRRHDERPGIEPFDFVKALPTEKQIELAKKRSAHMLSNFLHGEQGAMMLCGQLVEVVPDMDGKLYASTQVIDEARHVEVFHRYIQRLDRIYPPMPGLTALINAVLTADLWQMKCIGMQVIAESIAMGSFKTMNEITGDEVLRKVFELTSQDEARHVSYGLIYMKDEIPKMNEPDRDRLEDFAWTAMTILATNGLMEEKQGKKWVDPLEQIYTDVGIDPKKAERRDHLEDERPGSPQGPAEPLPRLRLSAARADRPDHRPHALEVPRGGPGGLRMEERGGIQGQHRGPPRHHGRLGLRACSTRIPSCGWRSSRAAGEVS